MNKPDMHTGGMLDTTSLEDMDKMIKEERERREVDELARKRAAIRSGMIPGGIGLIVGMGILLISRVFVKPGIESESFPLYNSLMVVGGLITLMGVIRIVVVLMRKNNSLD